ncbi:MAG: SIMPL domain-containing protein [Rhodanobacteraceae bacterium]|nr:MAG: SIMPL domain-containing protein [Rhodanobacteraceae bacterium]
MSRVAAAMLVAVGLVVGGWFIGNGFAHRHAVRYVVVKGLAERNVKADIALWQIHFTETGNQLADVQALIQRDDAAITAFLQTHKLGPGAIAFRSVQVTDRAARNFGNEQYKARFVVTGTIMVRTKDVEAVAAAAQDTGTLIAQGVVLGNPDGGFNEGPNYLFDAINALKPSMIADATKNARAAAEQFARDSDSRLGGILRANQGVFEILPRDKAPMLQQDKQIDKTVRVVATLDYELKD